MNTIRAIVPTLLQRQSVFSVNLCPYFAYQGDSNVSLKLASSGDLLKSMIEGVKVALSKLQASSLPVIVGETGWPTSGGRGTSASNAESYVKNAVEIARNSNLVNALYLFEALDEAAKPGPSVERAWGLYSSSDSPKYSFDIRSDAGNPPDGKFTIIVVVSFCF